MMRYQRRYHYDLTPEKLDALIEAARQNGGERAADSPRDAAAASRKPRGRRASSQGPTKEDSAELNA
jgi:hypothetical protein